MLNELETRKYSTLGHYWVPANTSDWNSGSSTAARQGPATANRTVTLISRRASSSKTSASSFPTPSSTINSPAAHELRIHCGDVVYQVDFPERVLLEHQIRDLEEVIPQIVDRLLGVGGPRQITFGKDGVGPPTLPCLP